MSYIDKLMKELKEACMEEKKIITFGDVLELLGRNDTEIVLTTKDELDSLTGSAGSELWGQLEERPICGIFPEDDTLKVWLEDEDGEA